MTRIFFFYFRLAVLAGMTFLAGIACGDTTGLLPPIAANVVDTATFAAIRGTPIGDPSGLDMVTNRVMRTDQGRAFDIAFDFDSADAAVLLPAGLLGFQAQPGWRRTNQEFSAITSAPIEDFVADSSLALTVGQVFFVRSRNSSSACGFLGAVPRYGKFHVLEINLQDRSIRLEFLVDVNCGYRGLEPGFPTS
jgi:hypothetical protein